MIPVASVPEPAGFEEKCRRRGLKWLRANPTAKRPRDYWTTFKPELAAGFRDLCGYSAMIDRVGTVDHFASFKHHRRLAYDWSNYRYASEWMNKSKQNADGAVLDPFEVKEGWFEILLPSLQMVVTAKVPAAQRKKAEYILTRLHLGHDERVIRQRRAWYEMFETGKLTLAGLEEVAPLIAAAVRKAKGRGGRP